MSGKRVIGHVGSFDVVGDLPLSDVSGSSLFPSTCCTCVVIGKLGQIAVYSVWSALRLPDNLRSKVKRDPGH